MQIAGFFLGERGFMSNIRFGRWLVVPMALALASCGINSVPTREEAVNAAWGNVQNEYQRRADLIPNLVSTVKGYAVQEKTVLVAVTEARAKASSIQVKPEDLNNPAKLQQFEQAQGQLGASLGRLLVTMERYPDLKSNQNFLALQNELATTENQITIARRDYNAAVQDYNTTIRTFPDLIGAKMIYGAKPKASFTATTPGADSAPKVAF